MSRNVIGELLELYKSTDSTIKPYVIGCIPVYTGEVNDNGDKVSIFVDVIAYNNNTFGIITSEDDITISCTTIKANGCPINTNFNHLVKCPDYSTDSIFDLYCYINLIILSMEERKDVQI